MENYRDIELVSMKREIVTLNRCVFAGLSRSCHQMLTSVSMEDSTEIVIVTEHTKEHLNKVAKFATTGTLYGYSDQLHLARDEGTVKAFADFGVDVLNLSLSPVPLKKDEVEYTQNQWSFKPRTNPTVIKNECEDAFNEVKLESEIAKIDYDHSSYNEEPIFEETVDELWPNEDEMLSVALKKKTAKRKKSLDKKLKSDSDPDYEPASKKANVSSKNDEQKSDPNPPNKTGAKKWKNYHYEFHNISMIKDPQLRGQKWGILRDDDTSSKFQRKNEAFFFFPQDEKLRDPINFPFQCMMCVRGFKNKKNFSQHVRRHDAKSERDRFFCMHCPEYVAFYEWKQLVEHNKTLHFRPGVILQCPYCPKTLKESQKLIFDRHVAKHEGAEERKEKHKLYIKRYHKGLPKVTCLSCGEEFDNKLYLAQHQKLYGNFHDGKCGDCPNFEAQSWEENLQHFKTSHDGKIQYKCGHCSEIFKYQEQLRRHVRKECQIKKAKLEEKAERVTCEECGLQLLLVWKDELENHKRLHHGKETIPCPHSGCSYVSKNKDQATLHEKNHIMATCEICGHLTRRYSMPRHMRTHGIGKHSFICDVCQKGFNNRHSFRDHQNIHTGAKPHKCTHCPAAFASIGTARGHIRAVHEGKKRNSAKI